MIRDAYATRIIAFYVSLLGGPRYTVAIGRKLDCWVTATPLLVSLPHSAGRSDTHTTPDPVPENDDAEVPAVRS